MKTLQQRFEEKYIPVTESGCWLWTACLNKPKGYGSILVKGIMKGAHRISYELHRGKIPEGLFVLHKCDVKCCVNPEHFFLGTQQDNIDDMVEKDRQAKGSKNGHAKLTEADVKEIKQDLAQGELNQREIGEKFGVAIQTISNIKHGYHWSHT